MRGLNAEGNALYQSVIVVRPESPISSLKKLRGKRFAFGSETSTQGHLIPRILLSEHGISLRDLAFWQFTGSHFECANAVAFGQFDAGGMQDTMGREFATAGQLRIIETSKFYPSSGIAANKEVPSEVLARVKQALLDFDPTGRHQAGLYHREKTEMAKGFIEVRDEDYEELRRSAQRFVLLSERKETP